MMLELMADMEEIRRRMNACKEQIGVAVDEPQHSKIRTDPMSTTEPKFMLDMMADMEEHSRQMKEMKVQISSGEWLGVTAVEEPQPSNLKKKKKKKKK